ncbi:MAG TPA: sodium:solute symporter family protein [Methanofastidiosum sp.]|nr:sodium:solute symporter family protein [Methanofastidiosum sp.]
MASIMTTSIIVLYFLITLLVGAWASKKVKSSEDYIVAGRSLGFWFFVLLVVSSATSGMSILGVAGLGYTAGWPSIWEQIFVPLTTAVCILFYGTKLHKISEKMGYMTVQDYFADRFYSPKLMRVLSGLAVIVTSTIYLVGQYTAISIVLIWLFGITHTQALIIAAAIVLFYVVLGGLYAVAWVNLIQGIFIVGGVLIVSPFILKAAGGFTHINTVIASIDPNFVNLAYPQMHPPYAGYAFLTPLYLVSFFFLLAMGLGSGPHIINNVLAVKKDKYFKFAPFASFAIYVVIMYLLKIVGFGTRAMVADGLLKVPYPDYAYISAVNYALPTLIWPLFAVIVLSAVMSTTDRLMLTIGSSVSWDIYKNLINPKAEDKTITNISRITVVVVAILTLYLAIKPPQLLALLIWMGIGIMLSSFVMPLLAGLYWKRATREGAIASMGIGFATSIIFGFIHQYIVKLPMHFSMYSFVLSVIAMIVVSLLTKSPSEKVLKNTLTGPFIQQKKR